MMQLLVAAIANVQKEKNFTGVPSEAQPKLLSLFP